MAAFALTNVQLLLGSMEMGPFSGGFQTSVEAAMKEANNFAALGYTIVLPGLTSAMATISGHADYATGAVNQTFNGTQKGAQMAFSVLPFGSASVAGDPAIFMRGLLSKMSMLTGKVGDVADFQLELTGDSAEVDGWVGAPLATRGALVGTAVQVGATVTGDRMWAALHITGGVFTNLAVTIQSDTVGFPSPATALTFSTVSAAGWQFISAPGPLTDDYFRVNATIGSGTATYAVVFGTQ